MIHDRARFELNRLETAAHDGLAAGRASLRQGHGRNVFRFGRKVKASGAIFGNELQQLHIGVVAERQRRHRHAVSRRRLQQIQIAFLRAGTRFAVREDDHVPDVDIDRPDRVDSDLHGRVELGAAVAAQSIQRGVDRIAGRLAFDGGHRHNPLLPVVERDHADLVAVGERRHGKLGCFPRHVEFGQATRRVVGHGTGAVDDQQERHTRTLSTIGDLHRHRQHLLESGRGVPARPIARCSAQHQHAFAKRSGRLFDCGNLIDRQERRRNVVQHDRVVRREIGEASRRPVRAQTRNDRARIRERFGDASRFGLLVGDHQHGRSVANHDAERQTIVLENRVARIVVRHH